jgi:hypothetical protein
MSPCKSFEKRNQIIALLNSRFGVSDCMCHGEEDGIPQSKRVYILGSPLLALPTANDPNASDKEKYNKRR